MGEGVAYNYCRGVSHTKNYSCLPRKLFDEQLLPTLDQTFPRATAKLKKKIKMNDSILQRLGQSSR